MCFFPALFGMDLIQMKPDCTPGRKGKLDWHEPTETTAECYA